MIFYQDCTVFYQQGEVFLNEIPHYFSPQVVLWCAGQGRFSLMASESKESARSRPTCPTCPFPSACPPQLRPERRRVRFCP